MKVIEEKCNMCEACLEAAPECPQECIKKINGKIVIDEERCTNCEICSNMCPCEAIVL